MTIEFRKYYDYALAQMAADSYLHLVGKYGLGNVLKLGNNHPEIPNVLASDAPTSRREPFH